MKLIIDGNTQEIELSDRAPTELSLDRDDIITLVIALTLAFNGRNYNDTIAEVAKYRVEREARRQGGRDELEAA